MSVHASRAFFKNVTRDHVPVSRHVSTEFLMAKYSGVPLETLLGPAGPTKELVVGGGPASSATFDK